MRAHAEHRGVVGRYASELGLHGGEECGKLRVGYAEGVGFHELEEERGPFGEHWRFGCVWGFFGIFEMKNIFVEILGQSFFWYINHAMILKMLRLLRRLDAFLGADALDPQTTHNALYVWFDILTFKAYASVTVLNKRGYIPQRDVMLKDKILEKIQTIFVELVSIAKIFQTVSPHIPSKNRTQLVDALIVHLYQMIDEDFRNLMFGRTIFKDDVSLTSIATQKVYNCSYMKTKEEVLEYALCEDTDDYWAQRR
jgi:hypothetical protein